jgi:hypothetical protein
MKLIPAFIVPSLILVSTVAAVHPSNSAENKQQRQAAAAAAAARLLTRASASASAALELNELPDTGEEWTTLDDGGNSGVDAAVQVQPASNLSPLAQEHWRRLLWGNSGNNNNNDGSAMSSIFRDGSETYYDEYAVAWRALGFYIDCDADQGDDGRRRSLQDEDGDGHCQRYMLWAAVRADNICGV